MECFTFPVCLHICRSQMLISICFTEHRRHIQLCCRCSNQLSTVCTATSIGFASVYHRRLKFAWCTHTHTLCFSFTHNIWFSLVDLARLHTVVLLIWCVCVEIKFASFAKPRPFVIGAVQLICSGDSEKKRVQHCAFWEEVKLDFIFCFHSFHKCTLGTKSLSPNVIQLVSGVCTCLHFSTSTLAKLNPGQIKQQRIN